MSCTIEYQDGKIKRVKTPEGEESRLFTSIAQIPHVETLEKALEIFKNSYALEVGESELQFLTDTGENTNSFAVALKKSTGGNIEIGFTTEKGFKSVLTVSSNTNPEQYGGFLNGLIKEDILSDKKIIQDGESFHQASGNDPALQMVNERIIQEEATNHLNKKNVNIFQDGRIELKDSKNSIEVDGKKVTFSEVQSSTKQQLNDKFGKDLGDNFFINNMLREVLPSPLNTEKAETSEQDLKLKLLDLLNSMGVKVTSISEYLNNYKVRNGVEPSAEALVDIANQVVAFKDGVITTELLSEEAAHFIVEAWDQNEIENLLRNINKTQSYQEFSEQYRKLYAKENPTMSEQEIENLVRREILGKELAKSFQENFSTEGKSGIQVSIIRKIYNLFTNFINKIFIEDNFKNQLEQLSLKVSDLILNKDINKYLNLEQTKTKKFNMYNAGPTSGSQSIDVKSNISKLLVKALLDQEKLLLRSGVGSRAQVQRLTDALDAALTVNSALELIKLSKRYASYLSEAIKQARVKGKTLTNEEGIVLSNLKDNIVPLMERLSVVAKEDPELNVLEEDIDSVLKQIGLVKGEVANTENTILNGIVDRLMARNNIVDPEIRPKLMKAIENATRDTQMLYSWFGQITHAHDPLLGILGSVIADMSFESESNYQTRVKGFQKKIRDLGFFEKDLQKIYDKDGYILSQYDFSTFETDVIKIRAELYKKYSGSQETVEEIAKKLENKTIEPIQDKDEEAKYKEEVTKEINKLVERAFTDEFYEQREKRFNDLGISQITRTFLKMISTDLGEFMSRAKTEKGLPRYRYQDRHNLDAINLRRRAAKSLFNDDGKLKNGLKLVSSPGLDTIESAGKFYEINKIMSPESIQEATIAFEMNKLDNNFMDEKNKEAEINGGQKTDIEKLAPKFLQELEKIEQEEGREAAQEFFLLNSTIGFSSDFWNNYDVSNSMSDVLDNYLKDPTADKFWTEQIEVFRQESEERKQIIKRYQDSKNYTNTLASEMPSVVKNKIMALSESIDRSYASLYNEFKGELSTEDAPENKVIESTPNQAYRESLEDNKKKTAQEKIEYAFKHMTTDNRKKVTRFLDSLDDFSKGRFVSENQKILIGKTLGISLDEATPEDIEIAGLKYAESKLLPYYKAFSPVGLEEFHRELKETTIPVFDLVSEINERQDIKVSNNFSYYEVGEVKFKNKNYKDNFEGGSRQPRLSKYLNAKFVETFGPILDSNNNPVLDANGKIQVTKNEKLFELHQEYLNFQKTSLDAYGEFGLHNIYLAPQISKTEFQKIQSLFQGKKGTLKDMWKDAVRFRVDDMEFGEQINGESIAKKSSVRLLPKYFMNRLESSNDVSEDIFNTSALFAQQAELYKAKKERYSEFAVLNDKMLNRSYPEGKAAEATNSYKMFKSYLDYNLFGVKELKQWRVNLPFIGQMDLTKVINLLHGWLRNNSLAFNIVVPATSWVTAEATLFMEKLLGQYVEKGSMSLANSEFIKISREAITESLDVNSNSKLSLIGEHFRVFNLSERFENSIYNKYTRTLNKSGYILHTAANFVPLSKAMLSQLFGSRVYGGMIVDFKKFEELKKLEDPKATIESTKASWKLLEDKNLYNYITIDQVNNVMTYDYNKLATDMGKEAGPEFEQEFKNYEYGVASKIKKLLERIDGQISTEERTVLQRHVLGRFIMTHKGWLSIAASNRFKKKHFNFQTGQIEEGSYLSVANSIVNSLNDGYVKEGFAGVLTGLKNVYKNGTEVDKENIRRVLIETSIMQAIFLVSLALSGWADDEKDMVAAQATAYLFERMANETSSSQFGVMGEFYSSMKEPIVGLNKINNLVQVQNLFDTDKAKRGRYKGLTNQEVYLIKNVVGAKSYFDLSSAKNLKSQRDAYDYFNNEESLTPIAYLLDEKGGNALIDYQP